MDTTNASEKPVPGSIADRLGRLGRKETDSGTSDQPPANNGIIPGSFEYHRKRLDQGADSEHYVGGAWPAPECQPSFVTPCVGSLFDDRDDAPDN